MRAHELALNLVGINSENPPGNERGVAKFIFDYLSDMKLDPEMMEYDKNRFNVICSVGDGDGIMLNGHMDTVPIGREISWQYKPYGEIVDGNLYGRGASDMKGGIACILASLPQVMQKTPKRRLVLAFVGDEENGFSGSNYLVKEKKDFLKDVKYGVIAEPTDMKVQTAQKGMLDVKLRFRGKSAHGSMPWLGENAIYKASKFIEGLEALGRNMNTFDPLLGRGTINVGRIQGGTKVNVVPDLCEIEVERRIVKGETPEQALEDILNVGKSLGIDAEVEVVNSKPAFKLDEDSEIVRMVKEFSGGETSFATGYTEAELYSRGAGIDCVVFGPGNKETIHTSNEYVKIENLEKCTQVFTKLIDRWCF